MPWTPSTRTAGALACGLVLVALAGCSSTAKRGTTASAPAGGTPATIRLESPAFADAGAIPRQFTCDGFDGSPPLRWSGVPAGAVALALVMEDPGAPGGTFTHWTLFAVSPRASQSPASGVPHGAKEGTNDFRKPGYGGPCPPAGDPAHHYVFTLHALRAPIDLPAGAPPADVRAAIARTTIAQGRLTATYRRG